MGNGKFGGNVSFGERFRDPRWERLQTRLKNQAGNRCQDCGSQVWNLRAHHHAYGKTERDPWDYDDTNFTVLCDPCHERWDLTRVALREELISVPLEAQYRVVGYLKALKADAHGWKDPVPKSEEEAYGMAEYHGMSVDNLLMCMDIFVEEPPF